MRIHSIPLLAVLFVAATSCEKAEKTKVPPGAKPGSGLVTSWPAVRTTDGGNFDVTVNPEGGFIEGNKHFAVEVQLASRSGDATAATVVVDADMPAHGHGMNTKPETSAIEGGAFRTEGMLLHMIGDWIITVDVTSGGKTERATFPVSVE